MSVPTAASQPHAERQCSGHTTNGAAQQMVRHGSDWSSRGPPLRWSDLSQRRSPVKRSGAPAGGPARAWLLLLLLAVVTAAGDDAELEAAAAAAADGGLSSSAT